MRCIRQVVVPYLSEVCMATNAPKSSVCRYCRKILKVRRLNPRLF
jgi:hypothetical protein